MNRFILEQNGHHTLLPSHLRASLKILNRIFTKATQTVLKNFHVDDMLKSLRTVEKAVELSVDFWKLLHKGGFNLTQMRSVF